MQLPIGKRISKPTGICLKQKLTQMDNNKLKDYIQHVSVDKYGKIPKPLQVDAVFNLAQGQNTFLLAGTGFGKSRISELYHRMIPKSRDTVILVLNPLDTLGNHQVLEKELAGFTAINLTKMNFDKETDDKITSGYYNFIYMSPEIYLNSKSWDKVYFSPSFQERLALIVVDEAHMVFIWGLVESGSAKSVTAINGRIEDYAIFRPCYGKLGPHLLF
ncbi:hypothetical protein Pst134EA_015620 [Puccinia striiformis f. sp. tritici]|uniref:hypothetical protein n=1 Tax=Puccinia striiformis f. sp. tritici TaxID=168172 RepID=UPI002007C809|nr:hypothetical protein Pst134EA_015620 [Puccinia striiformis f. sp. tritici]KAH9463531.1 hypothetical protein Pst134EA_015620 [Puccinia striiformis f. sp. tritici]